MKPISTITALTTAVLFSISGQSSAAKIDKRWFEVEVILFSQLGDKDKLQENFSGESDLPNYRTVIDLLTPHLQPDSRSLHVQLPSCGERQYRKTLVATQAVLPALHSEKSLTKIEQLIFEAEQTQPQLDGNTAATSTYEASDLLQTDDEQIEDLSSDELPAESLSTNDSELTLENNDQVQTENQQITGDTQLSENDLDGNQLITDEALISLSEEELALVVQAEQTFADMPQHLEYHNVTTYQETLCQKVVIDDQSTIADYADLAKLDVTTHFPIDSLTGRIDGNEFVYTDTPYLIDADSLKLKDITLQLRRSKNFKPLLHLGWRQPLTNRKKPSREPAIRLFAGQHYQQDYQNKLAQHHEQQVLSSLTEAHSDSTLLPEDNIQATTLSPKAQRIEQILAKLDLDNFETNTIVEELDAPNLAITELPDATETLDIALPIAPNQDWLLDGYFRLHLNHYLFITADFNVAVPNEKTSDKGKELQPFKLIPFKQNKRVISKEVHYFDHPHMGMVVQIRRYKKPEPEPEAEPELIEETLTTESNNG